MVTKIKRITIQVPSNSRPGVTHTITQHPTYWSCSCPSWRFNERPEARRACVHMEQVTMSLGGYVVGARDETIVASAR